MQNTTYAVVRRASLNAIDTSSLHAMQIPPVLDTLSLRIPAARLPTRAPSSSMAADESCIRLERDMTEKASKLTHQPFLPRSYWESIKKVFHNEHCRNYSLVVTSKYLANKHDCLHQQKIDTQRLDLQVKRKLRKTTLIYSPINLEYQRAHKHICSPPHHSREKVALGYRTFYLLPSAASSCFCNDTSR